MYTTYVEDFVKRLFISKGIVKPKDLTIENVAKSIGVVVVYDEQPLYFDHEIKLSKSTKQQEWQDFGHESTHYLRHVGNQLGMHYLFRQLQENQAQQFAYHFCVPTFMLARIPDLSVSKIMALFNVEQEFAERRYEMYQSKKLVASLSV